MLEVTLGAITKDDVLDAYEILELVLGELYVKHEQQIAKKVAQVNKRKGPARKK